MCGLKERQANAMQYLQIQNILSDPLMRQVLRDFQEIPNAAESHLKRPEVIEKVQLVSAGIVQINMNMYWRMVIIL
ncbi:hypothetical protein MKW94_000490 [Papaver nudicaule]|uniref:Uncharacterized protein n=1 Tax=Papaver nudicaule TaxID=74823 RepID=A0AA41RU23_PAPNU|nr:hypothetical protein [Papaver nudicaule]MCL7040513.1 hypothetical protein [Papaver nudicaule]